MVTNKERKFIKSLQIKKYRQEHQAFLVEGIKSVNELLNSEFEINMVLVTDSYSNQLAKTKTKVQITDEKTLKELSTLSSNNSALAVAKMSKNDFKIKTDEPIFILDSINDPGNLGTIVRMMDWFGYGNLLCSENSVDFYNPKTISAAKGSFVRIQPLYTNLEQFLNTKDKSRIYLMDTMGENISPDSKLDKKGIYIFGNEANGISDSLKKYAYKKIKIPQFGKAESLNVAMSLCVMITLLKLK